MSTSGLEMTDVEHELKRALDGMDVDPDELAFLALTSKPESEVRDRLAYRLHQQLAGTELEVAREWRRTDLAVLNAHGTPVALVEAKALHSRFAVPRQRLERWRNWVEGDLRKASDLAHRATAREAEIYALLVVTHIKDEAPPDLSDAVKYQARMRKIVPWREAADNLRQFLPDLAGEPHQTELGEGEAFDLRAVITTWLFGPVSLP
jgi:hypothetical protein